MARLMKRKEYRTMFTEAANRALPLAHQSLSLEQTMQLMGKLNLSWSRMRTFTTILRASGIKLSKCSEAAIKKEILFI